jgi:hypothetical protein
MSSLTLLSLSGGAAAAPALRAALASIGVLVLTSVHHVYGAFVYATPWRLHILYGAVPAAVLIAGLFWLGHRRAGRRSGRFATAAAAIIAAVFPVAMIGLYEGGYNHLLKNILYFGGLGPDAFQALFPAPTYERPNDFFFEATGVAQFFLAIMAAAALVRLVRARSN